MRERRQYKTRTFGEFYHSYIVIRLYSFLTFLFFIYKSIMQIRNALESLQRHHLREEMQIFRIVQSFTFLTTVLESTGRIAIDMRSSRVISMALRGRDIDCITLCTSSRGGGGVENPLASRQDLSRK